MKNSFYKSYTVNNIESIPQIKYLPKQLIDEIKIVSSILPFKVNNFVLDELINWEDIYNDPMFRITFPRKEMLSERQYSELESLLKGTNDKKLVNEFINKIRYELNPHPGNQLQCNLPQFNGKTINGIQHKYEETVLFFPIQGQTCHAYCTFCFRWPQFVGISELKIASNESQLLIQYIKSKPQITDIIFTGGDPMMMSTAVLAAYINPIIEANLPNLKTIRIGTKALTYWPYRFLSQDDTGDLFKLFRKIKDAGLHLTLIAHFNHPNEMASKITESAIEKIINAGIQIRTQSPIIKGINDSESIWIKLWEKQIALGCIPYYMFIIRDTGCQHYFAVPLAKAWTIFRNAQQRVSGISKTAKGPIMSCTPGKVEIIGISMINGEEVFILRMLQSRDPENELKIFFAKYDGEAIWIDDLVPAFGEKSFFFENECVDLFISDH